MGGALPVMVARESQDGDTSEQKPGDVVGGTHTALRAGVRGGGGAGGGGRENGSGQRVEHQGKLKGGNVLGCTHDQPGD